MNRKNKRRLTRERRRRRDRYQNDKPVDAYFPATCEECGFKARGPQEMDDHEHDNFRTQ